MWICLEYQGLRLTTFVSNMAFHNNNGLSSMNHSTHFLPFPRLLPFFPAGSSFFSPDPGSRGYYFVITKPDASSSNRKSPPVTWVNSFIKVGIVVVVNVTSAL